MRKEIPISPTSIIIQPGIDIDEVIPIRHIQHLPLGSRTNCPESPNERFRLLGTSEIDDLRGYHRVDRIYRWKYQNRALEDEFPIMVAQIINFVQGIQERFQFTLWKDEVRHGPVRFRGIVSFEFEIGYDAEIVACSFECPEEVGVGGAGGFEGCAVEEDDVCGYEAVGDEAVLVLQGCVAAA